jgi:hypothetical protein
MLFHVKCIRVAYDVDVFSTWDVLASVGNI